MSLNACRTPQSAAAGEAIGWTTNEKVGNEGQDQNYEKGLTWIETVQCDGLVNCVHDEAEDENAADTGNAILEQLKSIALFGENCPEVGWRARASVFEAVFDGENRGHDGVQIKAQLQGAGQPVDQVLRHAIEYTLQGTVPFFRALLEQK
jgi:hypothetical protein